MSAKVSFEPNFPFRVRRFSRTLPPTFLFLLSSVVKEQTSQNTMSKARPLPPQGPLEVAHAALLKSLNKGELLGRQRRAALVGEAYIGGTPPNCQQPSSPFLNFLRQTTRHQTSSPNVPNTHAQKPNAHNHISTDGRKGERVLPYIR